MAEGFVIGGPRVDGIRLIRTGVDGVLPLPVADDFYTRGRVCDGFCWFVFGLVCLVLVRLVFRSGDASSSCSCIKNNDVAVYLIVMTG